MIVEFTVGNFRSIKEPQTLSFKATGLKSAEKYAEVDENNIVEIAGERLLKTVGIYGANASGKSNIIMAMDYFFRAIRNPVGNESQLSLLAEPFLFQENPDETESFFQIVFMLKEKKIRYGFTVKKNVPTEENRSTEIITNEWLFGTKTEKAGKFFTRKGLEIDKDGLLEKDIIPALPSAFTLFLSHAASFNRKGICAEIRGYFRDYVISNILTPREKILEKWEPEEHFRSHAIWKLTESPVSPIETDDEVKAVREEDKKRKKELLDLLSSFQMEYDDIKINNDEEAKRAKIFPRQKVDLIKSGKTLNLEYHASSGTQKMFDLIGLLSVAFDNRNRGLIMLDELDSKFHPHLVIKLIERFNNPKINKPGAQLLFTSHDTNLMQPELMRRDQFYFTEKREDESTRLYALSDLRGIRNDADFARQYLAGFYGAVPVLSDYISNKSEHDAEPLGIEN